MSELNRSAERMSIDVKERKKDFARRANLSPSSVRERFGGSIRYIPMHHFDGPFADAWCEFSTEVALVESWTAAAANRAPGIWIRRDADAPQFLKVFAVVADTEISEEWFEQLLSTVAGHSWCADGFRSVSAGAVLTPLPLP